MIAVPSITEWTEEAVLAVALLASIAHPALAHCLASAESFWKFSTALELEGHRFDPRVNACTIAGPLLAEKPEFGEKTALEAFSTAVRIASSLHRGTSALPLFGLHAAGALLAVFVLPLFIVIGVPVGLAASCMTDWWLGEGIYRGLAQCTVGLWHDACTRRMRIPSGGPEHWVTLFEQLLLPAGDASSNGLSDGLASNRAVRFAALRQRVRQRRRMANLEPECSTDQSLFAFAASDACWQVPSFDEPLFRATFPHDAALRLQISGGGLRDHNFEVAELQQARRAFHLLWVVADCRDALAALDATVLSSLWALLPEAARQKVGAEATPKGPQLLPRPALAEPLLM